MANDNKHLKFRKIVKSIIKGKDSALMEFYEMYGKLIFAIASKICSSRQDVDEVVNDVLVKVWQMAEQLKDFESPIGWLCRTTENLAKDKLRSSVSIATIDESAVHDEGYSQIENYDQFLYMISILSEEEQQVMILKFVQDMTFESISSILNKPLSTITSTYYRAIKKIEEFIKKFENHA